MEKNVIKNAKFTMIDSVIPKYAEILVSFKNNNVMSHRYYFIAIKKGLNNADYIKEAKLRFNNDVKSNKIKEDKENKKRKPLLIALFSFLGVATLTFAGLYTYKMLVPGSVTPEPQPQPDPPTPPTPTEEAEIELDEETAKVLSIQPMETPINEKYHGEIVLKKEDICIITSSFSITMKDDDEEKELEVYRDYKITPTGRKDNVYIYDLDIEAKAITGDFTIHAPVDDFNRFKIRDEDQYKEAFSYFETVERLKVNGNVSMAGFGASQCATYDGEKSHEYTYGDGDLVQDFYTEITGTNEKDFVTWANDGTSKYWAYYPEGDVYGRPTKNEKPMTIADDDCILFLKSLLNFGLVPWSQVKDEFEIETLSYDVVLEEPVPITFSFSFYDGHFTKAYVFVNMAGAIITLDADFIYEFADDVELPKNVTYYDASEVEFQINTESDWQEAFTFLTPNLYMIKEIDSQENIFIYDGVKHYVAGAAGTQIYDTNGTNYYCYDYDPINKTWSKNECSEGDYEAGSYTTLMQLMNLLKDNAKEFTYYQMGSTYGQWQATINDVTYHVVLEKITTKGETPETQVLINRIYYTDETFTDIDITPIAKYMDTHIVLPTV